MVAGRDADKAVSAERTGGINAMTVADRIRQKLTEAFRPDALEVVDESHLHKGHAGHRPEGETPFPRENHGGGVRRQDAAWRCTA